MKFLFKLFLTFFLLTLGTLLYSAWTAMTPGERYKIIDRASSGDVDGVQQQLEYKAGKELRRQQTKMTEAATEAIADLSDQLIDQTTKQIKAGADAAAEDTKRKIQEELEAQFNETATQAAEPGAESTPRER